MLLFANLDFGSLQSTINSQPDWVWYLGLASVAALLYKFGVFDKFMKKAKKATKRSSPSAIMVPYTMLPPAVVEMKKSTEDMKQQLAVAVAAETEATVKEYTKYLTLTTSGKVL